MSSSESRPDEPETPKQIGSIWWKSLAAGLLAGLLATAGGELTYRSFHPEPHYPANFDTLTGFEKTTARSLARFQARAVDERNKAAAAFGILGAILGLILGVTGQRAAAGRSSRSAAVFGGVAGGLVGAGLSLSLVPLFFETFDLQTGLPLMFLTHAAIFGAIGAVGGLALAWGMGERRLFLRCLIGGVLGAFVATFASEVINFVSFPLLRMYEPVPVQALPRLLTNLWVAGGTAFGAGLAARRRRRAGAEM